MYFSLFASVWSSTWGWPSNWSEITGNGFQEIRSINNFIREKLKADICWGGIHRLLIFGGITYFKIMGLIVHFFNKNKNNKTSLITLQTTYILENYIMFVKIYITGKNQIRGSLPDDSQHGPIFLQLTFNR